MTDNRSVSTQAPAPAGRIVARDVRRFGALRLTQPARESLVASLVALGAAGVIYMWWHDTAPASVDGLGPWLTAAGRVTGLVGTYLIVVEVLLMGRVPWLDRMIGMDRLAVWHRRNGEYAICLLIAHAVLTIWGYAVTAHEGLVKETTSVVLSYPDMLAATVGLGLLVAVGILSARAVRAPSDVPDVVFRTSLHVHCPGSLVCPPVQYGGRLRHPPAQPGYLDRHVRQVWRRF